MTIQRSVRQIHDPATETGYTPIHRRRPLIATDDWASVDPFLRMMEDWFPRGVFDEHPHRGIETVTYVIDGRLDHTDSRGHEGTIGPGEVQWMTAGRGVIHNEVPAEGVVVHSLQLWVNLPAANKLAPPRYQDFTAGNIPVRREPGVEVRVFSGRSGEVAGPAKNHARVTMLEISLQPGARFEQALPAEYNGFVLVLDGTALLGAASTGVEKGQLAWMTRHDGQGDSTIRMAANGRPVRLLLCAGQPLREPVVAHGPFVMNTRQQIIDAFADYQAGRFGT
jgi:redox-sensitive bicupin YhaK (pirin superfamily)